MRGLARCAGTDFALELRNTTTQRHNDHEHRHANVAERLKHEPCEAPGIDIARLAWRTSHNDNRINQATDVKRFRPGECRRAGWGAFRRASGGQAEARGRHSRDSCDVCATSSVSYTNTVSSR